MNKNKFLISCGLGAIFALYVNMGTSDNIYVKNWEDFSEYNNYQENIKNNKYGKDGAEIMKVHLIRVANKITFNEDIYDCNNLQTYLPEHYTGEYLFPDKENDKIINSGVCLSKADILDHVNSYLLF